jgi:toxin-antitoxin system PIN domain toxin
MRFLIDVNVLIAAVWDTHPQHKQAFNWIDSKKILLCPLVELGFLRISTQPAAFNASMDDARLALKHFITELQVESIPCDLPALESRPKTSAQVTDAYLVALAHKHGLKLATMDKGIKHPAAVQI